MPASSRPLLTACLLASLLGTSIDASARNSATVWAETALRAQEQGDHDRAARLFERAARAGNRLAQFHYAMLLRDGQIHSAENQAAWRWLRRAAGAGLPQAQFELATLYGRGDGVRQSYAVAAEWHRRAAEQGHADAQLHLAMLLLHGAGGDRRDGVAADPDVAVRWLHAAARAGHPEARRALARLYDGGVIVVQDSDPATRAQTTTAVPPASAAPLPDQRP